VEINEKLLIWRRFFSDSDYITGVVNQTSFGSRTLWGNNRQEPYLIHVLRDWSPFSAFSAKINYVEVPLGLDWLTPYWACTNSLNEIKYVALKIRTLLNIFARAVLWPPLLYIIKVWLVNDKLERVWKEAVVAKCFGTVPAFTCRDWETRRKNSRRDSRSRGRDLKPGPLEHDVRYYLFRKLNETDKYILWFERKSS
jgi:hypothetical protein